MIDKISFLQWQLKMKRDFILVSISFRAFWQGWYFFGIFDIATNVSLLWASRNLSCIDEISEGYACSKWYKYTSFRISVIIARFRCHTSKILGKHIIDALDF